VGSDFEVGICGRRRGFGRAAVLPLVVLAAGLLAAGCGKSGNGAETNPEKGSDAAILNASLARELTLLDVYTRGQPLLAGDLRAVVRRFRAQQQEYVSALTKALRGLGGDVEAEAEELDPADLRTRQSLLDLLYARESAALAAYIEEAPRLYTSAPRTLDASLAAGHAQHLVLLRQAMGAGQADSIPEAFDGGEVPPPAGVDPGGGG
jgi:hypothetical protein